MSADAQPHPGPMEKISVETITMDDCQEVLNLLKAFFFKVYSPPIDLIKCLFPIFYKLQVF